MLTTKGYVKFVRGAAATALDLATERSKYGYLCVETMRLATSQEHVDPGTGEVLDSVISVLPSHYKSPSNGQCMNLADPSDWAIREGENA